MRYVLFASLLFTMGNGQSSPLSTCLDALCADRDDCVAYPDTILYQASWVRPYNLHIPVEPAAVLRPETSEDVAAAVKCAAENGVHVQAKSGGHSYANFGTGGEDGALMVDMVNFKEFSMDQESWLATAGAGFRLGELDEYLHEHERAIAHGVCPGVGLGGHATIGGLGPMSRMWGPALDHIVEVEVVTATGDIVTANNETNADLFWALRGAGSSFGIITNFVLATHPEPAEVVEYTYHFSFGTQEDMAPVYKQWQEVIGDPDLDWRFSSLFIAEPLGAIITGTFYGTEEEYIATGLRDSMPGGGLVEVDILGWLGHLAHQAEVELLYISEIPTHFDSKSLTFREEDLLPDEAVDELFNYVGSADIGTIAWFVIFDTQGGYTATIPDNSTAYPHRNKPLMYQSYAVGIPTLSDDTQAFVSGVQDIVERGAPGARTKYAGYVDPDLDPQTAQETYWGDKLPMLREVKRAWDPDRVFKNPHSVEPAEE